MSKGKSSSKGPEVGEQEGWQHGCRGAQGRVAGTGGEAPVVGPSWKGPGISPRPSAAHPRLPLSNRGLDGTGPLTRRFLKTSTAENLGESCDTEKTFSLAYFIVRAQYKIHMTFKNVC